MPPALSAHHLHLVLGGKEVLSDINLTIPQASWTTIVGPNGAGKSSLLRSLVGLSPAVGEVRLFNKPLGQWPVRQRATTLAWLEQAGSGELAIDARVYDVVMLGRLPHRPWLSSPTAADHQVVSQALQQVGAWEWRGRSLASLSGGERQRVLLARLLAVEAEVMLLDEPLANLDPPQQAAWIDLLRQLAAKGRTVVTVLHEISLALRADVVIVLEAGRLRHSGKADEASSRTALSEVFAGRLGFHQIGDRWIALPE